MRALVVIAHPCSDSFTHAAADRVVAGLRTGRHDVTTIDLYDDGFVAAMSLAERRAYHSEQPILDPMVQRHADLVAACEIIVFVYPTWWSGLPAMLKGWLERVMVPGVAFRFHERSGKVKPALTHVRRVVGVSTYGSPHTLVRLVNDNGRRVIMRALRITCGFRTRTAWLGMYSIDTATESDRAQFLERVESKLASL